MSDLGDLKTMLGLSALIGLLSFVPAVVIFRLVGHWLGFRRDIGWLYTLLIYIALAFVMGIVSTIFGAPFLVVPLIGPLIGFTIGYGIAFGLGAFFVRLVFETSYPRGLATLATAGCGQMIFALVGVTLVALAFGIDRNTIGKSLAGIFFH